MDRSTQANPMAELSPALRPRHVVNAGIQPDPWPCEPDPGDSSQCAVPETYKIVVAGAGSAFIARYNLDGSLDTTFGVGNTSTSDPLNPRFFPPNSGITFHDTGTAANGGELLIQPDRKLVHIAGGRKFPFRSNIILIPSHNFLSHEVIDNE